MGGNDALTGDGGHYRVAGGAQLLEQGQPPAAEHQQASHQLGEVGVAMLDQAHVAELGLGAEIGQLPRPILLDQM